MEKTNNYTYFGKLNEVNLFYGTKLWRKNYNIKYKKIITNDYTYVFIIFHVYVSACKIEEQVTFPLTRFRQKTELV